MFGSDRFLVDKMIQQSTTDLFRRAMFDRGVQAAKEIGLVNEDLYICPICGNCHDAQALDRRALLLEHVPPRALGGKPLTLTCKECNTRKLSYADSQLVKREKGLRFFEKIYQKASASEQWFKLRLEDTEVNGTFINEETDPIKDNRELQLTDKIKFCKLNPIVLTLTVE